MRKKRAKLAGTVFAALSAVAIFIMQLPTEDVEAKTTATADFQTSEGKLMKYQGAASTVSIPTGVEEIGEEAFAGNTTLVSVNIPSSVKKIDYGAFAGCTSLEHIFIPDGTEELGNGVFAGCSKLTKVTFGKDVKSVGSGMFVGCSNMQKVDISKKNENFVCDSGVLYDKEKTTVIEMLPGRKTKAFNFPSTVTTIRPYAFWGVENLQKVLLSQNIHEIPAYAFSSCDSLTGIEIPYSVYRIELKAFENCTALEEVILHPSVNFIHDTAFAGCSKLKITAEEGTYGYEFAQTLPIPEEKVEEDTKEDGIKTVLENIVVSDEELVSEKNSNTDSSQKNSGSTNTGYVDPLELPEDSSVLGKTRVIGNNAFVIVDGAKPTVH